MLTDQNEREHVLSCVVRVAVCILSDKVSNRKPSSGIVMRFKSCTEKIEKSKALMSATVRAFIVRIYE